ncbi:MAG: glycosyl hydrolase family 28-related protein, partial [Verrucomicrobiota bacterium]
MSSTLLPVMRCLTCFSLLLLAVSAVSAEDIVFPPDAGVVDVSKAPYFAKGDGKTDDTDAIQQALFDHPASDKIVYLPDGTYLVSASLRWAGHEDNER